jgi:hypothetical protein
MNYDVEKGYGAMIYVPSIVQIDLSSQICEKAIDRHTDNKVVSQAYFYTVPSLPASRCLAVLFLGI